MKKDPFMPRAVKLADWFVRNQVRTLNKTGDANSGRFAEFTEVRPRIATGDWSTNWTTGMTVVSLVMMYERTKDKRYLESALSAGRYLASMQVFDARTPRSCGMIREATPQTTMAHPRDALSAAWGMLHLYRATGDKEWLERTKIFAEWFGKYAVKKGYPAWTVYTDGSEPYWQQGSFHGGSPLYFFDLYKITGNVKWKKLGLTICDAWIRLFPRKDGSISIEFDPKTGRDRTFKVKDVPHTNWQYMHRFNDDFTALALMRAWKLTKNGKYVLAVRRYLDWVLTQMRPDGTFGRPPVDSAAATLIIELLDFAEMTGEARFLKACLASVPHFFSLQELKVRDGRVYGGYYCVHKPFSHNLRKSLGVRTAAYALAALLKLEGKRRYLGYTA